MDEPFKRLKKTLFNLYQYYDDDQFFFIGAAVGRITFKKFFQLIDEYNLNKNSANSFLALQLKHDDYKQLPFSDQSFSHTDAARALEYLKRYTAGSRLLAFIISLHRKNDELKNWFAPLPDEVPRLTFWFAAKLLEHGLKQLILVRESWARKYFRDFYQMSDQYFDNFIRPFLQLYSDSKITDDGFWFDFSELAEIEQIFINEKSPPASEEQKMNFVKSLLDERSTQECLKILDSIQTLDPKLNSLSVVA